MTAFQIEVRRDAPDQPDAPQGVAVRAGTLVLTRLRRTGEEDEYVQVPPAALAFWLTDHWWRLRWECIPPSRKPPGWRLAHEFASIGGGFAWPNITIWGERNRVGVIAKSDDGRVGGPVRYLTDALTFIDASDFETAVDRFLEEAASARTGFGSDRDALRSAVEALREERADPEFAKWRRIEAMAGFDVDEAPDELMEQVDGLIARYGVADVEEAVSAAPGAEAAATLEKMLREVRPQSFVQARFDDAVRISRRELGNKSDEPWKLAERASLMLRNEIGVGARPLRNAKLSEITGVAKSILEARDAETHVNAPYGVRLRNHDSPSHRIFLRSRRSADRRFELARCLGDAVWTSNSPLGPIAFSGTERQKFQRAFAASLLCPHVALISYLGTDTPTDSQLAKAAKHFHVNERMVRTVLVNKKVMERQRLDLPFSDLRNNRPIEELVEAA